MFDNLLAVLTQAIVVATLVERTIQAIKTVTQYSTKLPNLQKYLDIGLSLIVGALGCYFWNVDLLAAVGLRVAVAPYVGPILTGVLTGAGSNILHILYNVLQMWRAEKQYRMKLLAK